VSASEVPFRVLDLNLLRVFDALLREGSVADAAARLRITPSAVSHALGRMRYLFKDPLFVRSPHGMRATPLAAEIGPRVREGLLQLESALAPRAFVARESVRTFTIACNAYVCAVLLPGVISAMRRDAPKAGLAVKAWGGDMIQQFLAGRIDLLLGDFLRIPAGFGSEELFRDRPVWLIGRDYVLPKRTPGDAGKPASPAARLPTPAEVLGALPRPDAGEAGFERRIGLDEYSALVANPHVAAPYGTAVGGPIPAAIPAPIPYAVVSPLVAKRADLAALLPRRLAVSFARNLCFDLVDPACEAGEGEIRIIAVWQRDFGQEAVIGWLRRILVEAAAALPEAAGEPARPRIGKSLGAA